METRTGVTDVTEGQFSQLLQRREPYSIACDIETGPADLATLESIYTPPADLPHPGIFSESNVKTGHLRDPAKIAEKIWNAREEHRKAVKDWEGNNAAAKQAAWESFVDKAPLSAVYGKVVAIGYGFMEQPAGDLQVFIDICDDEQQMLLRWLRMIVEVRRRGCKIVGHNNHGFDWPFLLRRCMVHGIRIPQLRTKYNKWDDCSIDTLETWRLGDSRAHGKLGHLAKLFKVPGKLEGVSGAMFWKLLRDGHEKLAREYLRSDIVATHAVASKMFLI